MRKLFAPSIALLTAISCQGAHAAGLFVLGGAFTVSGTNSPTSFSDTVTLATGAQSLDGGALTLNISFVPAGGGAEWLVFDYTTTNGGPLSGDYYWSLNQIGLDAAVPVNFIRGYNAFLVNGVSQPWSYSFFGGYTPAASPIPGQPGTGVVSGLFTAPFPAGPLVSLGAYTSTYSSYLSSAGIDPTKVNGYIQALEFEPQTSAVPELSTWAMMIAGFAGLGLAGYRRQGKADAIVVAA